MSVTAPITASNTTIVVIVCDILDVLFCKGFTLMNRWDLILLNRSPIMFLYQGTFRTYDEKKQKVKQNPGPPEF